MQFPNTPNQLLAAGRIQDAIGVFELNVAEYPDASNPYDSLGEAQMKAGDKAQAIKNYKKALELNPDMESAKEALKTLGAIEK